MSTCVIGTVPRYQRPVLTVKVEGSGKMIVTKLLNMVEIGKALKLPPEYPTKYLACSWGAAAAYDPYSIGGSHTATECHQKLEMFIKDFVLCTNCNLPELVYSVKGTKKARELFTSCLSCGHYSALAVSGISGKVKVFVINNPPPERLGFQKPEVAGLPKEEKKSKDKEKSKKKRKDEDTPENGQKADDKRKDDKGKGIDDGVWTLPTDDDAIKRRELDEIGSSKVLKEITGTTQKIKDTAFQFKSWVEQDLAGRGNNSVELYNEIERIKVVHHHKPHELAWVACTALWRNDILVHIKACRDLYAKLSKDDLCMKAILGCVEVFVTTIMPAKIAVTSHILKTLYLAEDDSETGILNELVVLEWANSDKSDFVDKAQAKAVRTHAAKFTDWLDEASDGSSSEEGEGEDEEDSEEAAAPARAATSSEPKRGMPAAQPKPVEEGSDVDIDDI